jgi:pSer/pThr/pTyr-binding forkhead associated (FHA) protein
MNLQIHVLGGSRAGMVYTFPPRLLRVGRDADAEVRLDPNEDLEVSTRHAVFFYDRGHWFVRDENSTNGTFLNQERIESPAEIHDGDRIGLGPSGPVLEVQLQGGKRRLAETATVKAVRSVLHSRRSVAIGVLLIVVVALGSGLLLLRRDRAAWEQERWLLLSRMDSVLHESERTVQSLQGERTELAAALRATQEDMKRTRTALERAHSERDTARVEELQRQLQSATVALSRQQLAATLDFGAIETANRGAVARVYVEGSDDTVRTATAFAVRADGTLLTVRHLLHGADGTRRPRRIAVQFADAERILPGRVVAVSDDVDLALLRVDDISGAVTIPGLNLRVDTLGTGAPVAVIGFPLGGAEESKGRIARPLLSAGVLAAISSDVIEVQGYGAAGASGSPIVDATGKIIAILFGGRGSAEGPLVLGIPASAAARFLEANR